ncbi:hypothetical protein F4780DRAFT_255995 [Xylariomycetidae sp. FL0641]|nr:hypothetical protein F4780DRAFT_255995 [Xylariomycetidae sp. FL0641]
MLIGISLAAAAAAAEPPDKDSSKPPASYLPQVKKGFRSVCRFRLRISSTLSRAVRGLNFLLYEDTLDTVHPFTALACVFRILLALHVDDGEPGATPQSAPTPGTPEFPVRPDVDNAIVMMVIKEIKSRGMPARILPHTYQDRWLCVTFEDRVARAHSPAD